MVPHTIARGFPRPCLVRVLVLAVTVTFAAMCLSLFCAIAGQSGLTLQSFVTAPTTWLGFLGWAVGLCALIGFVSMASVLDFAFHHRIFIGIATIVLCVFFNVSGSSIGMWATPSGCNLASENAGLLFGTARGIRTDEWLVLTPFFSAQGATGFPLISETIRGASTVTSVVYALPSWSLPILFHPFLAGFLLLGFDRGLAFFWSARLVCLFLASTELGLLLFRRRRGIAMAFGLVCTFAPHAQWWIAINGIAELFIFGSMLVVLLHRFLAAETARQRWLCAVGLFWCAGCYLWILYPAWQILFFYVFLLLGAGIAIQWFRAGGRLSLWQWMPPLAVCGIFWIGLMGACAWLGWPAIQATLSTVYPGARDVSGGDGPSLVKSIFSYLSALGLAPAGAGLTTASSFFTFFPLGLVFGIASCLRRDKLSIALASLAACFLLFMYVEIPVWLAKITFLSQVLTERCPMAIGYIETLLCFRALTLASGGDRKTRRYYGVALALALVLGLGLTVRASQSYPYPLVLLCLLFGCPLVLFVGNLGCFLAAPCTGRARRTALACAVMLCVLPGALANPIQQGTAILTDSSSARVIRELVASDPDALWASERNEVAQYCVANGAATINSVNVYPDLERWHRVDPTGRYEDIYNRYAHIRVNVQDEHATTFELVQADLFSVDLSVEDVRTLGIDYYVSSQDMTALDSADVAFTPVASLEGGWTIYHVE